MGAIGARTKESQGHREMASGLLCPIGFKNSTDGALEIAIDASRGNSGKLHKNQLRVCASIGAQIAAGNVHIAGLLLESNLVAGAQVVSAHRALVYGQSITDACIGWDDTVDVLNRPASVMRTRRQATHVSAGQVFQPAVPDIGGGLPCIRSTSRPENGLAQPKPVRIRDGQPVVMPISSFTTAQSSHKDD
ncbi:hypothetical protein [Burkholderia sp. JP2-270]|uniref:hypothetical protein n=1 Tax=Burkholderia sp. JP2-270 TaxID=2217913 RepID=UPI0031B8239C